MLWKLMVLSLALRLATALRRAQYPNETYRQYHFKMLDEEPCFYLQQIAIQSLHNMLYEEQVVSMSLLWNNTLEQAAAALLRATLLAAGYDQDFIELHKRDSVVPSAVNKYALTVELQTKNNLLLQARFIPDVMPFNYCIRVFEMIAAKWDLSPRMLRHCGFLVSGTNQSENYINIYIVREWNNTCVAEKIRRIAASSDLLRILYLDRSDLTDSIRNSNRSFFFLDTYKKYKPTNAWPIELPNILNDPKQAEAALNNTNCISTEIKKIVLLKYAIGNNISYEVPERVVKFFPSLSDLSGVISENYLKSQGNSDENDGRIKGAACTWVIHTIERGKPGKPLKFNEWQKSAVLDAAKRRVVIIICKTEGQDLKEYLYMMKMLADYKNLTVSTFFNEDEEILLQTFFIDCANTNWFAMKLTSWFKMDTVIKNWRYNRKLIGVILPNEQTVAAAPFATKFDLPLMTYDIYSGSSYKTLRSATGSVEHLVLALRRFIAICGWQRLAIISESTRISEAVSATLRSPTTHLTVRHLNIKSTLDIPSALQKLLNADTRVFLVNTGAATAAAVLAAARDLGITRDKGFVWIVREYDAADHATAATRPYSVSFWWRGERRNETNNKSEKSDQLDDDSEVNDKEITDLMALRLKLEDKWKGRAWPLHAAPLLDALITHSETESESDRYRRLWSWNGVRYYTPGIKHNVTYNNYSLISPLIFLEQWGTEPRPRLLATWRGGEWHNPNEACPAADTPTDGTRYCVLPSGDSFQPICRDFLWITLIFIGAILIIATIHWCRKAFLAHNLRIKTEYAKRMLARQERTFEALAEKLVDRKELELLQELGKGRFGRVYRGLLRVSGSERQTVVVATKALQENASSAEESEFLKEACTLATLDHKHIIRFVGVCVIDGPPLLLMEHAFFGDLLQYLQARRCLVEDITNTETTNYFETDERTHVSAKAITKLAHEAATALAYLAQCGIVHRDVRASNCLVDDRRCLKLADFGLARATGTIDGEYQMCRRGVLPVLWMAPESLAKGVFSPASDVWSFGVLVFELVTLGRRPYGVQPPPVVLRHVVAGGRPQLPWDANAETRALTRACWRREPEARPTPARIAEWLNKQGRMLRPALVAEFVDIDTLLNENDFDEPGLSPPNTTHSELQITQP